ncbi:MAG: hypothetical protein WCK51_04920 [Armatimonadota bacterium]
MPRIRRLSLLAKLALLLTVTFIFVLGIFANGLSPKERWRRTAAAAEAERWQEFVDYFPDSSFKCEIDRKCAVVLLSTYFGKRQGWCVSTAEQPFLSKYMGYKYLNDLSLDRINFRQQRIAILDGTIWDIPLIGKQISFAAEQKLELVDALNELAIKRFPHLEAGAKNEPALAIYEFLLAEQSILRAKGADSLYHQEFPGGAQIDMLASRETYFKGANIPFQHIAKKYGRVPSPSKL